jgi:hypothetical protein
MQVRFLLLTLLFVLCLLSCLAGPVFVRGESGGPSLPQAVVQKCPLPLHWDNVRDVGTRFILADCSGPARQSSIVKACWTPTSLRLFYLLRDDYILNPYRSCNQPLYQYDAVEAFIGPHVEEVHHYLEMELSPHAVLFVSNITNPNLVCQGIKGDPLSCSLFDYKAALNHTYGGWWGEVGIPWFVLYRYHPQFRDNMAALPVGSSWRINFFRVDQPAQGRAKEYSCWSCDYSSPPCFHKPAYFGTIHIS